MDKRELSTGFVNASSVMSKVLQELDMSVTDFANSCGVSYNRISDILRGRTKKFTPALVNTICDALPQISKTFLYTGEGEVLEEGYVSKTSLPSSPNAIINKKVNELMRLQQDLLNKQTELFNKMQELAQKEVELTAREHEVKARELNVIQREANLLGKGKSA